MAEGVVTSLVENVVGRLFGKAKEEISYMWNCSKNIEDLKKENEKLMLRRRRILEHIKTAKEKGDRLLPGVEEWVAIAESHINEAKEIIEGAKAGSHISEAKEVTDGANTESNTSEAKVITDGADADSQISVANEVTDGALAESHITEEIEVVDGANAESHVSEANEDIANKTCFNLGMCVNPGTLYRYGKMAAKKVPLLITVQKDGETFESCVSIPNPTPGILDLYKSRNIDDLDTQKSCLKRIRESIEDDSKQIIGIYGIGGVGKTTLAKEVVVEVKSLFDAVVFITVSQPVDAERIKKEVEVAAKRIWNGDKVLVILDDLWGELKLDEVGIPCGAEHKNCKILLTSRSEGVCKTMKASCLISVATLPTKEAWILFKRVVGDTVETDEKLKIVAEKVVKGCGGLPLIIQAVGGALKDESIESWKRALTQLQEPTTSDIDPNISLAYSHLQLSYDFLKSEEAKSCFLLCSMFPEDYDIPLESLAYYGVGLEIFKDLKSMEDARNRVQYAVTILKSTCLLLDGKDELTVKMHDVVREIALLIASKGGNKLLVKAGIDLTEWQPRAKRVKSCTGISLMYNRIEKLPDYDLEIPLLDIFLLQGNDNGVLKGNRLSKIPDKFILGVKEAKVLDFGDNNIVSLPPSMKQLTKLCVLNLGGNESLGDISILGDLKSLEILILSNTGIIEIPQEIENLVNLRRLEVKNWRRLSHITPNVMPKLRWLEELHISYFLSTRNRNHKGLLEIGELSMLTFLDLFVPQIHLLPEGVWLKKLKGFVIQIGGIREKYKAAGVVHKKILILGMKDLDTPSMLQVKELIVLCDGIIFDEVLNANNTVPTIHCESLDELTTIMLTFCKNLLSLVGYSSGRVVDEEVGGRNTDKQFILRRNTLRLGIQMNRKKFGGENTKKQFVSKLEHLHSRDSDDNEEVIGGENTKKQYFSKLEHLFLLHLSELQVLWNCPDQYISLKNLVTVYISVCDKLVRLFSVKVAEGLVSLKTLKIEECRSLEEVICDGDQGNINMIVFPRLVKIELCFLKTLKSFYAGKAIISFPSLEKVKIYACNIMDKWDYKTYDTPNLKLVNQVIYESSTHRLEYTDHEHVMHAVGLTEWPVLK